MVSGWPTRWSQDTMVLPSHSIQHVSTQTKAFVTAICSNFMEGGWNFFYEDWWLNTSNVLLVTANKWDALPRVLYAAQREPAQLDVEWQRWGSSPHLYGRAGNKKTNLSKTIPAIFRKHPVLTHNVVCAKHFLQIFHAWTFKFLKSAWKFATKLQQED